LHGFWTGITALVSSSPWVAVVLALLIVNAVVGFMRAVIHSGPRDPVRRFTRMDKATILARAGGRCEHHSVVVGRCRATENLEADHVHPHSRGGWTHLLNGQALCRRHNKMKRATVPYEWQLRALAKRRAAYYPVDVPGAVTRRAPRARG
jgi:5-methylcytosine-specific restriction endonuclease McrA